MVSVVLDERARTADRIEAAKWLGIGGSDGPFNPML
jgi:hypothetical protein